MSKAAADAMPRALLVYEDEGIVRKIVLSRPRLLVGSGPENDLIISDPRVAKRHATIAFSNGVFSIASARRTVRVDGRLIPGTKVLEHGTEIDLEGHILRFVRVPEVSPIAMQLGVTTGDAHAWFALTSAPYVEIGGSKGHVRIPDPDMPELAFAIDNLAPGLQLVTALAAHVVELNEEPLGECRRLRDGDRLTAGESEIVVRLQTAWLPAPEERIGLHAERYAETALAPSKPVPTADSPARPIAGPDPDQSTVDPSEDTLPPDNQLVREVARRIGMPEAPHAGDLHSQNTMFLPNEVIRRGPNAVPQASPARPVQPEPQPAARPAPRARIKRPKTPAPSRPPAPPDDADPNATRLDISVEQVSLRHRVRPSTRPPGQPPEPEAEPDPAAAVETVPPLKVGRSRENPPPMPADPAPAFRDESRNRERRANREVEQLARSAPESPRPASSESERPYYLPDPDAPSGQGRTGGLTATDVPQVSGKGAPRGPYYVPREGEAPARRREPKREGRSQTKKDLPVTKRED